LRKLGMYSPEIRRETVEQLFDAVHTYGFEEVQFSFLSVGPEEMPMHIDDDLVKRIRFAADENGIAIRAVNGTFNMAHPDPRVRAEGLIRFREIARICEGLGCQLITLCTGSRNRTNKWKPHSGNKSKEAWYSMLTTVWETVLIAEDYGLYLGMEPEASNIVDSAEKAIKLIREFEELEADRLKIIFDPANLFHTGECSTENSVPILEHAFSLLKDYIVLAHGKDILAGPNLEFTAGGRGIVDFTRMLELLDEIGYDGPVIAHGIRDEQEFPDVVAFFKQLFEKEDASTRGS